MEPNHCAPSSRDAPGKGQTVGSPHKSRLGVQSQPKSPEQGDNEETTTVILIGWRETASPPSTLDGEQAHPRCPLMVLALLPQAWDTAYSDCSCVRLYREPLRSSLGPP